MEIIFLLMGISMFMASCGLLAFLWANSNGQFDDLESPAQQVLLDDSQSEL